MGVACCTRLPVFHCPLKFESGSFSLTFVIGNLSVLETEEIHDYLRFEC